MPIISTSGAARPFGIPSALFPASTRLSTSEPLRVWRQITAKQLRRIRQIRGLPLDRDTYGRVRLALWKLNIGLSPAPTHRQQVQNRRELLIGILCGRTQQEGPIEISGRTLRRGRRGNLRQGGLGKDQNSEKEASGLDHRMKKTRKPSTADKARLDPICVFDGSICAESRESGGRGGSAFLMKLGSV